METPHKKTLKSLTLGMRHLLEGYYGSDGKWHPGDLEQRLASIGIRRGKDQIPVDELPYLPQDDRGARRVVDTYLELRGEAGISQEEAVAEFVRETAYSWANRLLALRCMEARELIDEVILQKEVYGGRSLEHHRLVKRQPDMCDGDDDGLFIVLYAAFIKMAERLPIMFDPKAPGVALRPSVAALKRCIALLSGAETVNGGERATDEVFKAPDAPGWAYQFYQTEEKKRVDDWLKTKKGFKCETPEDIAAKTALYTEPYMVKFLVQNSLGATWGGIQLDTKLTKDWEYFVRDADRAPIEKKPVREITFLDPACGSGHFLIEAFDLFYDMYIEEGELTDPEEICSSILQNNLYGIDIDERAVQIAEAALWMKAAEKAFGFNGAPTNLVATNIRLPKGKDHIRAFLKKHPEDETLRPALEVVFESLEHAHELGSLLQIEEPVEKELRHIMKKTPLPVKDGELIPASEIDFDQWKMEIISRVKNHFAQESEAADLKERFFGIQAEKALVLFDILARRYDVVAANPPYLGAKKYGARLKTFLKTQYADSWKDLFGAFIKRGTTLTVPSGYVSMVTQQGLLNLDSYAALREHIIFHNKISLIVQLGEHAFFDPDAAGAFAAMSVFQHGYSNMNKGKILFFDVSNEADPNSKKSRLHYLIRNPTVFGCNYIDQNVFTILPGRNLGMAILPQSLLDAFDIHPKTIGSEFKVTKGLKTGADQRYVRYNWECSQLTRWKEYHKGGGYCRWSGREYWLVDWEHDGARVKARIRETVPANKFTLLVRDERFYDLPSLTYSSLARGAFGVRPVKGGIGSDGGQCLIHQDATIMCAYAAVLTSRSVSMLLRGLTCGRISVDKNYVIPVPLPSMEPKEVAHFYERSRQCLDLKSNLVEMDLLERTFHLHNDQNYRTLRETIFHILNYQNTYAALLHYNEGFLEREIFNIYGIESPDVGLILAHTGVPSGWNKILYSYDKHPITLNHPCMLLDKNESDDQTTIGSIATDDLVHLKTIVRSAFESGPKAKSDANNLNKYLQEDNEEKNATVAVSVPIPPETFLEELSQKLEIHPISVYWLLKEGVEEEGWRCLPEERRITTDRFTVMILRLLGHRWPKQIEANGPVPEWADEDGVIPITVGTDEDTLLTRVRQRIGEEFENGDIASIEREFEEIIGRSLDKWLETEFIKHHAKQFKKRPIAWQLQSGKFTARRKPAFACLVYYHKLDGDTLPKIRNQYVAPMRKKLETELRGIEAVPSNSRTEQQDSRRIELQDLIKEIDEFDLTLQKVSREGFACKTLEKIISKEPVDKWCSLDSERPAPEDRDAMLQQEAHYYPDINDGVRVNIVPLQKAGLLAADVLAKKDVDKAISDRAEWRADERRWCREGKLPRPGWWKNEK